MECKTLARRASSDMSLHWIWFAAFVLGCGSHGQAIAPDAGSTGGGDAAFTCSACGPAGCCTDHCCAVEPSNADVTGELQPTGLAVTANGTFDTNTECTASSALGNCTVVPRSGLPEACVCRMDRLAISNVRVSGAR